MKSDLVLANLDDATRRDAAAIVLNRARARDWRIANRLESCRSGATAMT